MVPDARHRLAKAVRGWSERQIGIGTPSDRRVHMHVDGPVIENAETVTVQCVAPAVAADEP